MRVNIHLGDCLEYLKRIPSNSVNLILTSPPYDDLRTYGGNMTWNLDVFKDIAKELARVLKDGGVMVWNVCDRCIDGGYSCTSHRQVLYFVDECGLKLNDTVEWVKPYPYIKNRGKRYQAAHEPLYVFSKGKLMTFNPIMRECKSGGKKYTQRFVSQRGCGAERVVSGTVSKETTDYNVWTIQTVTANESSYVLKDGRKIHHTAVYPMELARRVIQSWSDEGDVVLDPFLGSGTSGLAAVELGRNFIGCEQNQDYYQMASERIQERMNEVGYRDRAIEEQPQKPLKQHLESSDALSERKLMKVVSMKGKKHKLYIQRVECNAYDDLGFSQCHYIDKPINKAAMCFLVSTAKGQPLAFLGFLNHTFKGCSNGIKVSRFVILPHHHGKGLAMPILSVVCGMLKSRGYRVFINTENPRLGEGLVNSSDYRCTTFNCVNRTIKMDDRYKHRRSGTAYRVEYIGDGVHGYSQLLGRVADMRAQRESTQPNMEGKVYVIPNYYGYVTSATWYRVNPSIMCSDGHIVEYTMPRARGTPMAA